MSFLTNVADGWINTVKKIGLTNHQTRFSPDCELTLEELSTLYDHDWLARRIVDAVVDAAFERGFTADGHEGDWHQINTELHCNGAFQTAAKWGRLHGGALLVCGYQGDLNTPAPPSATAEWFEPISCIHIHDTRREDVGGDPADFATYRRPIRYRIRHPHRMGGETIDASRVVMFDGVQRAPQLNERTHSQGPYGFQTHHGSPYNPWGLSVLTPVMTVLRQHGLAWSSVSELMQVSSVGVMKMAGLIKSISRNQVADLESRAEIMQTMLSLNKLLMLDSERGEEYTRVPVSFADVPHLLTQYTTLIAGAADMPVSILFGQQPGGMNSNSDSDRLEWDSKVDAYRTSQLTKPLQSTLEGMGAPEDIEVDWGELQVDTRRESEDRRTVQANTDRTYWQMGVLEPDEIRRARVADGTLGLDVPPELPEPDPADVPPVFPPPEDVDAPTENIAETDPTAGG